MITLGEIRDRQCSQAMSFSPNFANLLQPQWELEGTRHQFLCHEVHCVF